MAALCLATVSGCTKKKSYEPGREETTNDAKEEKQGSLKADTANDEKKGEAGSDSTDTDSEETSMEEGLPEELTGVWTGKGEPEGGGNPIDLEITVNSDATGEYQFEQAGYKESYPFTLESEDRSFQVNIPADNQLGITSCKGTYSYEDDKLTLQIKTEFSSGRTFEYTAVCTKKE